MITLVTGGAGFIGSNMSYRLLRAGERVRVLDNLSRPGCARNIAWLEQCYGDRFELVMGDVRDAEVVDKAMEGVSYVFHFAAKVGVPSSLVDPMTDFSVNGLGALNVLEAARRRSDPPSILYTSTSQVYGALSDIPLRSAATRYEPIDHRLAHFGLSEERPLDFRTPHGCSKGTADQYVIDYARTFGLVASVFRVSCVYGPRQLGSETQSWLAELFVRALRGEEITIYGDGRQLRDALYVDDLIDAMLLMRPRSHELAGQAFNVGGGPQNTLSLLELLEHIERLTHRRPNITFERWRFADRRWYVSDTRALGRQLVWEPRIGVHEGLSRMFDWLSRQPENRRGRRAELAASPS